MSLSHRCAVAVAALCVALPAGIEGSTPDAARRNVAQDQEVAGALQVLDAWIAANVAQREQPGLSIGIVHDQDLIWAKGYGFADVQKKMPATPSTLYRIPSISKLFTSTAILQLRDGGKLRLDDPVASRLPWFSIKAVEADAGPVTIRHLLTHTSGLPREAEGVNWSDLTFPAREAMVRALPAQQAAYPIETEWKYSNLALSLAGEIVAAVSGEPWDRYVERSILGPLGMSRTRVLPAADMPGLAVGYRRRVPGGGREVEPFVDIGAESPAGSLASNVEDLARFASLQFRDGPAGGAQILKGSTLREMHRVHWLRPDWQSGWGLGFAVRRVGNQVRIGHGGSLPGHRCQVELAPVEKLAVIVLTNANDGDPLRYVNQAFTLVGPAVAHATAPPRRDLAGDPAWKTYVGTYTWKEEDVQVLVLNGELTMVFPQAENPWESRIVLKPVRPHTFRMTPAGVTYAAIGELLTFEVGDDGRATRLRAPNSYWVPRQADR
jgi:CubicO group peptidase (beta-lactamase class C family)